VIGASVLVAGSILCFLKKYGANSAPINSKAEKRLPTAFPAEK